MRFGDGDEDIAAYYNVAPIAVRGFAPGRARAAARLLSRMVVPADGETQARDLRKGRSR